MRPDLTSKVSGYGNPQQSAPVGEQGKLGPHVVKKDVDKGNVFKRLFNWIVALFSPPKPPKAPLYGSPGERMITRILSDEEIWSTDPLLASTLNRPFPKTTTTTPSKPEIVGPPDKDGFYDVRL